MASCCSIARACSLVAIAAALLVVSGCRRAEPLPVYGTVPRFQMTAQTGQPFDSSSLNGKIWVVDFIFTNCNGPCPRMTSQMRQVQKGTAGDPDVRQVSISIDPKRDTPAALAAFAQKFKADTSRWTFLTAPQPQVHHLSRYVFLLSDINDSLQHSTRFVLVDRKGRIRGWYETSDADSIPKLIGDIKQLEKEPVS